MVTSDWMRPLGGTGLEVSAVSAGCSGIGRVGAGGAAHVDRDLATVRAVLDSPIRVLDTSNGYAGGNSERRIGEALAAAPDRGDDVLVITKVDPRDRDYSGDRVRASVAESRERLGLDRLPMVHLHDPEFFPFEELSAPGGAVDALADLKERGEVDAIGLAGGRVQEMERYLRLGVFDVLLVHNRWTLVDRGAGDLIAEAVDRGMAVVNAAVYGGGVLAADAGAVTTYAYREAPPEVLAAVEDMRAVCLRHGTDLATAALQFSLRDPRISTTVVGMSRPERVAATLAAASAELPQTLWGELETHVPPPALWIDNRQG